MRIRMVILILAVIVFSKITIDVLFKIHHHKKDIYTISNFHFIDSLQIKRANIILGKNIKGYLEAIIIPENQVLYKDKGAVKYIYIRFFPLWFEENIKPFISSTDKDKKELKKIAGKIHKANFKNFMHFNKYPLLKKTYVPIVIRIKNSRERIILEYRYEEE